MKRVAEQMQAFCPWQECHDENSGYSYYWNMTTNEVTWEMPADYRLALQKWQLLQQQQSIGKKMGNASSQMPTSSVAEKLEASKNKLSRSHKDSTSVKKKYPFESDSEEDEKIELITSYGSDSSDNSDNESLPDSKAENINSNKKSGESKLNTPRILKSLSESDSKSTNTNAYGPCFPPDGSLNSFSAPETNKISQEKKAKSVSLVPYGDASDVTNSDESFMNNSNSSRCMESINSTEDSKTSQSKPITSENKTIEDEDDEGESDDEDFDEDESLILSKLRSQAMVLKNLGGEIPDEIKCLIDSENPDIGIDDIIALIENEQPPDHTMRTDSEKLPLKQEPEAKNEIKLVEEKMSSPNLVSEKDSTNEQATTNKSSNPFALIAGYGDDSDQEESSPPKNGGSVISKRKALFPIDEKQNKSRNANKPELSSKPAFKKIKLSARAKALINASIITAKARATPSINVTEKNSSYVKPDSSVCLTSPLEDELAEPVSVKDPTSCDQKEFSDTIEEAKEEVSPLLCDKVEQPEKKKSGELLKHNTQKLGVLPFSNGPTVSQLSSQLKPSISTFAADLKPVSSGLETSSLQSNSYTSVWDTAKTYATEEKRGLGFCDDTKSAPASSFSFYRSKSEKKETGIQFVKAETINVDPSPPAASISEIGKEDGVSKSEIESMSEVIVEKVKFLSEGKEPVSPVQIMTIQVETLVSAWQAGCLLGKYLLDWLNATSKQLTSLEEEAAPPGWKCEWDRSFNRYYYRSVETGNIQWEYPAAKDNEETFEEVEMELCETPPPPSSPAPLPPGTPPPPPEEPPLPKTPPPPVISFSPPPPPVISGSTSSSKKSVPKKKSKVGTSSIELPPLPVSPPPLPKNPPPPPPSDTPLPPLPPLPSESCAKTNVPLPPSLNASSGYKRQKIMNEFNMSNAQFFPAQQIPPPPPTCPPPLPPSVPLPQIPFQAVSQQPLFPSVQGPIQRSLPCQLSNKKIGTPAFTSQPTQAPLPAADSDLNSVLDSFYSDIASLEATIPGESTNSDSTPSLPEQTAPAVAPESEPPSLPKKKKKVKLAAGLTLKKKGLDSLVAKWEKVHKSVCD